MYTERDLEVSQNGSKREMLVQFTPAAGVQEVKGRESLCCVE